MNKTLIKQAVKIKPDIVWIDKTQEMQVNTLIRIKGAINTFIISETADNMLISGNISKDFLSCIPKYDLMITDKCVNTGKSYYNLGAKIVYSIHKGYYPLIHRPVELTAQEKDLYETDVVFCGVAEHDRAESLAYLINNGIKVKIWGAPRSWNRMECFPILKPSFSNKSIWWDEYAKAINGAKIAICFLRHIAKDTQTQRTFELPACLSMTIAERTEDHMKLFEEDKEMVFFSDNEELLYKIKFYLSHQKEREDIAKAGRLKCINSNYTYAWRYGEIIKKINEIQNL